MLRHGLTASFRGLAQVKPMCRILHDVATGTATQLGSSWTSRYSASSIHPAISILHSARLLSTSTNSFARLSPSSSRRRTIRLDNEQGFATIYHANDPNPSSSASAPQQPSITRALLFLFGFSALTFTGAAYYSLRETEHIASEIRGSRDVFAHLSSFFSSSSSSNSSNSSGGEIWGPGVTEKALMAAKQQETAQRLGLRMQYLVGWCQQLHLPQGVTEFVGRSYIILAERYLDLSPAKQAVVPVVAVNSAVFLLWTVASARRGKGGARLWHWMNRNFVHRPSSNRPLTLLTSVFSHQTALHFLFNNLALWSIGGSALYYAAHRFDKAKWVAEASLTPHFLTFFTTAGMFAATVSHIVSSLRFRRFASLHGLALAQKTLGKQGSLGSSGAVYSALVMSAFAFPDAQLGIIFLPWISVPIGMGVVGVVAMDVVGIVRGWRMFDHWAHLGGAMFGCGYWYGGARIWEWVKEKVVGWGGFGVADESRSRLKF
ncbi:related to PCP1 - mitochondrial serine protease [Ustilago trichophora]|uniref:Related to PCP1 - mitochondrial serine protease n=1 Tax=Ustilago trichophora TaxID=86804 RepID=A0A5C3EU15_9BASI|nr:related to PCP1 - mitochondrial serine protease [Ustilago trichophora]